MSVEARSATTLGTSSVSFWAVTSFPEVASGVSEPGLIGPQKEFVRSGPKLVTVVRDFQLLVKRHPTPSTVETVLPDVAGEPSASRSTVMSSTTNRSTGSKSSWAFSTSFRVRITFSVLPLDPLDLDSPRFAVATHHEIERACSAGVLNRIVGSLVPERRGLYGVHLDC